MKDGYNPEFTKSYYKIKEVSELLGVAQSALRFWEKEFPMLNPRRSSGNQRYYSPEDMELLQIIKFLLHDKGMKLEAAREELRRNRKNISKKMTVLAKLEAVKDDLEVFFKALNVRSQKLGI